MIFGQLGATRADVDVENLTSEQGLIIQASAIGDRLGRSVSSAGDVNNDGIADIVVGAPSGNAGGRSAGQAYVIYGTSDNAAPQNHSPQAVGQNMVAAPGTAIPLANLFNWSDEDGLDDLVQFAVRDRTQGGGWLTRDGVRMPYQVTPFDEVPMSEIGRWAFVVGDAGSSDQIGFNAIDREGAFNLPSATATVTAVASTSSPIVSGPARHSMQVGDTVALAGLFSVSDVDGAGDIARIRFWDSTPGSDGGRLHLDGSPVGASFVDVVPAELSRVTYVAGPQAGSNPIIIEAFDQSGNGSNDHRLTFDVTTGANRPPEAVDDVAVVVENTSVEVDVLTNDRDADGDALWVVAVGEASNGQVTLSRAGAVSYRPNFNFTGEDSFSYRMTDGSGAAVTGTVAVTVLAEEEVPYQHSFFSISGGSVTEGSDLNFTISRSGDDRLPASVEFDITLGGGWPFASSEDVVFGGPVTVTFGARDSVDKVVSITTRDDSGNPGGDPDTGPYETVIGVLANPLGGAIIGGSAEGRILEPVVSGPAAMPTTGNFIVNLHGGTWTWVA